MRNLLGRVSVRAGQVSKIAVSYTLIGCLLLQPMMANAQTLSAGGSNRPTISAAPNGVPLVDITTPNSAGLSHNQYNDFNVGISGIILNNFKGEVGTSELGGVTPGNPNLRSGNPATVILNEVISGNRSILEGPTEVFGSRASVVIANPNGLTCDGCGFINTPRIVLSTGTPDIAADGSLSGLTVRQGDVTIGSKGGNFADGAGAVDIFDIVSRSIKLDGPVYGKDLQLVAGPSRYTFATRESSSASDDEGQGEYAIDGSALGAMQADRIKIIVNEKGAGVSMRSDMAANAGELTLSADGKLSLGKLSGNGVALRSRSSVQTGEIRSSKSVTVQANAGVTIQSISANEDILVSGGNGLISLPGMVTGTNLITLDSSGGVELGNVQAAGSVQISGRNSVRATGALVSSKDLSIVAQSGPVSASSLVSYGNMTLSSGSDLNVINDILGKGNVSLTARSASAGSILAGASLSEDPAADPLQSSGAANLSINLSDSITARTIASTGDLILSAQSGAFDTISAYGDIRAKTSLSVSDQLYGRGDVTLDAGGGAITLSSLDAHGFLTVSAGQMAADTIRALADVNIQSNLNVSQQLLAGGQVDLQGSVLSAGTIISGLDFTGTEAAGGQVVLSSKGDTRINAPSGTVSINTLMSGGSITGRFGSYAGQDLQSSAFVDLIGSLDLSGQLLSGGDLTVTGDSITIGAAANTLADPFNTVARSFSITAGSGGINAGSLISNGNMTLNSGGNLTAQARSDAGLTVTASGTARLTGTSYASGDLAIIGASIVADDLYAGIDVTSGSGGTKLSAQGELRLTALQGAIRGRTLKSATNLVAQAQGDILYDNLQSFGAATLNSAYGSISIDRQTQAKGNLNLFARNFDLSNNRAKLVSSGKITLTGDSATFSGSDYTFSSLDLRLSGTSDVKSSRLRIVDQPGQSGDLAISAANILTNTGTLLVSQGNLTLSTDNLDNYGQLAAGRNLSLTAANFSNRSTGLVNSGGDQQYRISGTLLNDQGTILAGQNLDISGLDGRNASAEVRNLSGVIEAEGDLTLNAGLLFNGRTSNPTWDANQVVSSNVIGNFKLNAAVSARPFMHLFYGPNNDRYWLYQDLPRQDWDDYKDDLWSEVRLADGSSFHAWTWISSPGPTKSANILAWVREHAPRDAEGNLVIDPNNPSKIIVQQYESSKWDQSTIFNFDDNAYVSQTVTEDRLTSSGSAQAVLRSGGNMQVSANHLSNSYSAIEAGGSITLQGQVLDNKGLALYRTAQTYCKAQGACEAYDAQGNRDPSRDIASGTSSVSKTEIIGTAGGLIKAAGSLAISGFATINNTAVAGSMAGGAQVSGDTQHADPIAGLSGLTGGGALFQASNAIPGLTLTDLAALIQSADGSGTGQGNGGGLSVGPNGLGVSGASLPKGATATVSQGTSGSAGVPVSSSLEETLRTAGAALAATAKPTSGGFGGTIPGQVFLFETRAEFLDVGKFYGSAYYSQRIGYQPDTQVPFLGDAYFENQLIEQQLRQQTGYGLGNSFKPGADAIQEMKLLLDNGVDYVKANNLSIGERLSDEQIASLTRSIVVYEKRQVQGADVLVPVVYLASADKARLTTSGALIAGDTIDVQGNQINNSGALVAQNGLSVQATDIIAEGGSFVSGSDLALSASRNLSISAQSFSIGDQQVVNPNIAVLASGNALLSAESTLSIKGAGLSVGGSAALKGQDIVISAVTAGDAANQNAVGSMLKANSNLLLSASNDISVAGSSLKEGDALSLFAENGSVNIGTVTLNRTVNDGYRTTVSTSQQSSHLAAGGSTNITAANDINLTAANLKSGGNVSVKAGDGITIATAQETSTTQFGRSTIQTIRQSGSAISADGFIAIQAGESAGEHDLAISGSQLDAKGTVDLRASGDVAITEARDQETANLNFSGRKYQTSSQIEWNQSVSSSVAGATGVQIASGRDTLISGSDVKAGNDNTAANLTISAGRDLTIAAAIDTVDLKEQSSSRGFLKKTKAAINSYDETTIGSGLAASGNVSLSALRDAAIVGSQVGAGQNLALSGENVAVLGAEESHSYDTMKKSSGLFVGSGGGFVSLWGKAAKTSQQATTQNVASTLKAGQDLDVTAWGSDLSVIGSQVEAGNDLSLAATRDINVTPGAERSSSKETESRSGFGLSFKAGNGGISIGIGKASVKDEVRQSSDLNAEPELAAGRDLNISAGRDANLQAAKVTAARDLTISALRDVNLLAATDQTNYAHEHEEMFAGVTLSVSSKLAALGEKTAQAAGGLDSGGAYALAPTALAAVRTAQELKQLSNKASPLASMSLTIGASKQTTTETASSQTPVVTSLMAGGSVAVAAEEGSIRGTGVQIAAGVDANGNAVNLTDSSAGNILLSAAQDITLESATASGSSSSSSTSISAGIGLSATIGKNGTVGAFGPTVEASASSGKVSSAQTQQVNSHVTGTGTVALTSGADTTLKGALASGNSVIANVDGDLLIESLPDTAAYDAKSNSASIGFGTGGVSGSANTSKITGDYANVSEQSGIVAGSGGYHIAVGGGVDLKGGVIASSSDKDKNFLTADHLTFSDVANVSNATSSGMGIALGSTGIPLPVVSQPAEEKDKGKALATLSPGNLSLANQAQDLANLNTDLSKANTQVQPFDIARLKARQQSAAALSELLNIGVGDLAQELDLAEGSPVKTALHGVVGALVSLTAGGNVGTGALAGAASELVNGLLQQVLAADPSLSDNQKSALTQWVATAVGAAVGGQAGAAAALDNVNHNYLNHADQQKLDQAIQACSNGDQAACSEQKRLQDKDAAQQQQYLVCRASGYSGDGCGAVLQDVIVALSSYSGIAPIYLSAKDRDAILNSGGDLGQILKIMAPYGVNSLPESKQNQLVFLVQLLTGDITGITATPALLEQISNGDAASMAQVLGLITKNSAVSGLGRIAKKPDNPTDEFVQTENAIGGTTCVYSCVIDGTTRYVGITDDIVKRGQAHLREKGITITKIRGLDDLSRSDARAVEQVLIEYYGLEKNGGTLMNKINSISAVSNPSKYEQALVRGAEILKKAGYEGF